MNIVENLETMHSLMVHAYGRNVGATSQNTPPFILRNEVNNSTLVRDMLTNSVEVKLTRSGVCVCVCVCVCACVCEFIRESRV
jgi:hypothetical protein